VFAGLLEALFKSGYSEIITADHTRYIQMSRAILDCSILPTSPMILVEGEIKIPGHS